MYNKYKQTIKHELSFVGEKLTRERHKIHPYPAMLHPLLVDFLIQKYAKKGDAVFDPFCGSGVTLLQSCLVGHKSYGFDINPLALLIAKVKVSNYIKSDIQKEFVDLKKRVMAQAEVDIPNIKNVEYWYSKDSIQSLGAIRSVLLDRSYKYKDFFVVCFAYTCRNQSYTRKGEFKRYRIRKDLIEKVENNVYQKFFEHTEEMIEIFCQSKVKGEGIPMLKNSEDFIDQPIKYDLVITSPPYGDSKTTVAYGEYSSFGVEWTAKLNPFGETSYRIDSESLGKKGSLNVDLYENKILETIVNKIKAVDDKRVNDVIYFFNGYYNAIKNIVRNLNAGGRVCFVVGNRTVKGFKIPMDQITSSFLEKEGLKFENIFVREILNKVMPSKNSPSNKVGLKVQTMSNEYIVVFTK